MGHVAAVRTDQGRIAGAAVVVEELAGAMEELAAVESQGEHATPELGSEDDAEPVVAQVDDRVPADRAVPYEHLARR